MNAFIHDLNHVGANFTGFAFSMLVQSSLLIVALFLLDLVLRKRVRAVVRYPLWTLVLVKLVLPPSFAAPTGLAYWLPERKLVKPPMGVTPPVVVHYSEAATVAPAVLQTMPLPRPQLQVSAMFLLAWLAIALGLVVGLVRRSHSVARAAARATSATNSPEELLEACQQKMGIKQRVRLKLSANTGSPAVCGLWRPVILIPQALADRLTPLQMRAVLFHELAHIQRGDVWVNYAQTLLQILYWWHPLLWLANAQIRRVREQAVDEQVMVDMGGEAEAYPATLLEVAKLASRRTMTVLGLIGIVESKSALAQRIRHLLDRPPPKSAKLGCARLAVVALVGAVLLPMARGQRPARPTPAVNSTPGIVSIEVRFVELTDPALDAISLGDPTVIGPNGHRAWVLPPEDDLIERMQGQADTSILFAPTVTTHSGQQAQIRVTQSQDINGNVIDAGPVCDLLPEVSGEWIDLSVIAKVTEFGEIVSDQLNGLQLRPKQSDSGGKSDEGAVHSVNATGYIIHEAGTARVSVADEGFVVLQNPEVKSINGKRILVVVSPRIVRQSASVLEPNKNATSVAASPSASNPLREATDARRTPSSKSPESQPTNTLTRSEGQGATMRFASSTGQDVESEAIVTGAEIQYDPQTGICVVTNDFVLRYNGAVLTARRGQVNSKTGEVIAEGDVTLRRGDQVLHGERLRYNFVAQFTDYPNALPSQDDRVVSPYADASATWTYNPGSYLQLGVRHQRNQTDLVQGTILDDYQEARREYKKLIESAQDQDVSSDEGARRKSAAEKKLEEIKEMELRIRDMQRVWEDYSKTNLTVTIARGEPYFYFSYLTLDTKPASVEELRAEFKRVARLNPAVTLSIRADKDAPLGLIVKVMDAAKEAGIKSINVATGPLETNGPSVLEPNPGEPSGKPRPSEAASSHPVPLLGDLPFVGQLFRSKSALASPGSKAIQAKLNRIVLPEVVFDNVPLPEAIRRLAKEASDRDPDGTGVNFLLNPNVIGPAPQTAVDPNTGEPVNLPPPEPLDMNDVIVRIKPPFKNVRLADALEAIVKVADKPIRYWVEGEAVVFARKQGVTAQLETRIFKVDPWTFMEDLGRRFPDRATNDVPGLIKNFFTASGVNVLPPNTIYYKDRLGMLMVRATAEELGRVQKAVEGLNALRQKESASPSPAASPWVREDKVNQPNAPEEVLVTKTAPFIYLGSQPVTLEMLKTKLAEAIGRNPNLKLVVKADPEAPVEQVGGVLDTARSLNIEPFSTKSSETTKLETRVFRVHPQTFLEPLRAPLKSGTIEARMDEVVSSMRDPQVKSFTIQQVVRDFFATAGVNLQPPNSVFFNDRTGALMVRATAREMDSVEKVLDTLNYPPPQVTIEARFIEIPTEVAVELGLDLPRPNASSGPLTRILTAAQAPIILRKAEQRAGVDILSAPKITTLSGRLAQIQVVETRTVVTGIDPKALAPPGVQSTEGNPAQPYLTSQLTCGPTLDVAANVASDGYTIHLTALPQVTEFLRYDTPSNGANATRVWVDGQQQNVLMPVTTIRTRQMQASVDVYDGQTLVLANPRVTLALKRPAGESLTNSVPEETGKRLLVLITATIIDPAGNPIHPSGSEPWADKTPPQRP